MPDFRKSAYSIFIIIVSFSNVNYGQLHENMFERISKDQGLIPGNVNDILQDSLGFIWMATEGGLCRYDGYNFIYYKNHSNDQSSLSYNHVFSLLEDKNGIIWVGTLGGGLNKFDSKTGKFKRFRHDPDNSGSISGNNIFKVFRDSRKRIWISTLGNGLNLFDPRTETFTHFKHSKDDPNSISSNMVSALYEDKNKNFWIGTFDSGMNLFVEPEKKFIRYKYNGNDRYSLSHNQVMEFLEDDRGRFWVATFGGGVNLLDRNKMKFQSIKSESNFILRPDNLNVRKLFEDKESIWVGTYNGLFRFDKNTFKKTTIYSNPNDTRTIDDNKIRSIYKDRTGVIWIGTIAGVNKFDTMKKKFDLIYLSENYRRSLDNIKIVPLKFMTDKILWAGPGKSAITKNSNRIIKFFGNADSKNISHTFLSTSYYLDEKNILWVGSYNGIQYYDLNKDEFQNVQYSDDGTEAQGNNFVKWFYIDKKNRFWAGTMAGGLTLFDPKKNSLKKFTHNEADIRTIGDSRVNAVLEDSHRTIWIATFGGLDVYNEKDETFSHYRVIPDDSTSISNDRIYDIYESKAGDLWIGTYQGLNRYNRNKNNFEQYSSNPDIGDNTIFGIQEDSAGILWIRTNDGISRFDPTKKIFRNYNSRDGLPGMEWNGNVYFQNNDGKMFFGFSKGLISFYPKDITDNPIQPQVAFTKLIVMDHEVEMGENSPLTDPLNDAAEVILSYKDKVFSFEFSALHYAIPSKNRYAYKLEGFLDNWVFVDAGSRSAKFTNLNPGKYKLIVRASNNDGIWGDSERSITIIITPPFWETWWFRLLVFFSFLGIIFLFYEIRLNKLLEIEHTRSKIARNLHDEVGGTLSSIQYFVRAVEKEIKISSENTSKYLDLILQSSADAQEKIKDLIWTVNPEEDGLGKFLIKFNRYASDLLDSKEINYNIELPAGNINKSISMETRQHFWCICKETVTNIVRHSQCKNVIIKFIYNDKRLDLSVEDDGIGFNEEEKSLSDGLVNIKNRAEALKAEFKLSTGINKGTKWFFSIKI